MITLLQHISSPLLSKRRFLPITWFGLWFTYLTDNKKIDKQIPQFLAFSTYKPDIQLSHTIASRVPLADDLHLVCTRSADNLDPPTAWKKKKAFTHCVVGERLNRYHQAWTARNLRIPTMPWILLRPSGCFSLLMLSVNFSRSKGFIVSIFQLPSHAVHTIFKLP